MNTKTLKYILKRILLAVLTVWVVITVTFFVMRAVPGGPFLSEKAISEAAQAALEAKYGLDKPVFEQYTTYLKDIVTKFDFGPSVKLRGRDVIDIIVDGMKVSAKLGLVAASIALVVGVVLGSVAALRRNKFIDKVIMVMTTAFISMPSLLWVRCCCWSSHWSWHCSPPTAPPQKAWSCRSLRCRCLPWQISPV